MDRVVDELIAKNKNSCLVRRESTIYPITTRKGYYMHNKQIYNIINENKVLLNILRCYPDIEKTALAREMKISFPTLTKQLDVLKDYKILSASNKNILNEAAFWACGISIGGAQCKITFTNIANRVIEKDKLQELCDKVGIFQQGFLKTESGDVSYGYRYFDTPKSEIDLKIQLNSIIEDVLKIDIAAQRDETVFPVLSIGIALTGSIDAEKQIIISSHNVGYLKNLKKEMLISPDLLRTLKEHDIPVIIDHNAKALAVCEKYSLYQTDNVNKEYCNKKNIVSLYLGSGIGSGLILDNRLVRGCRNLNGEIGHIEVPRYPGLQGKELIETHCTCGATGCLENYIVNDVFRMSREEFKGLTSKQLIERLETLYPEEKQERLKILGYYIGWVVDLCVKFLNVGLIIFSGKITSLMDELWQYITPSNSNVDYGRLDCAMIKSRYGALAPTIGAAILSTYSANESIEWPIIAE